MANTTHKAYLLLGGNLGNREANLEAALRAIGSEAGIVASASPLFETAAWGVEAGPAFLNQALELHTGLLPQDLLRKLLSIESRLGRERRERYGPRTIDIDILLYDDLVLREENLQIPHPQLPLRRFALTCLAAIAPDLVHPVSGLRIDALLAACPDMLAVNNFRGS